MSSSESDLTPEFIKSDALGIINNLLPEKSKDKYLKAYDDFLQWKTTKKVKAVSESVLLVYFEQLASSRKPSSLWCIYSMLRSTISIKHNIQINTYSRLLAFLKRKSEGHRAKKSKIFSTQNVETFLNEAPDYSFLAIKVALIFGVNGACRGNELLNIKVNDIEKHSDLLLINLPDTKTKRERSFVVRGEQLKIVDKYRALRPSNINTNRFFLNYCNGKCTRQVIGKNKIGAMPQEIAKYLKLQNVEQYTGHCFRRTSATFLADSGANITQIKQHGGWKSDAVAEGYIENSIQNKNRINYRINKNIHQNIEDPWTPLVAQPSTSRYTATENPLSRAASPTFTDQNNTLTQVSEPLNTQINSNTTSINVPNKNITLSFHNWTNVSNVNIHI